MVGKSDQDNYKLKLTGAGISIEQSVDASMARNIISIVMGGAGSTEVSGTGTGAGIGARAGGGHHIDPSTPKAFMSSKKPQTDMERVTCLAYYLTSTRQTATFKTKDLTDLNIEAAQPKLSNPSATARNAVTHGYLSLAGGSRKQITARGEALINALPDRDKVASAMAEHTVRKPRKRKKTGKK